MAKIKNPLTIVNTGGQDEPTSPIIKLTAYDRTTGVITGEHLGTTAGTVYMLNRDTNTYVSQPVSSWADTSITLTTPLDLVSLEGTTSIVAVMPNGVWSTKLLVTGDIAVTGYGKIYIKDLDTGVISTMALTTYGSSQMASSGDFLTIGGVTVWKDTIVGVQFGPDSMTASASNYFLSYMPNLNQPVVLPSTFSVLGGDSFLNDYNYNQPIGNLSRITTLRSNFLSNAYNFNQPIDVSNVTSFSSSSAFLASAYNFNQPITLNSSITSIPNSFCYGCRSLNQPITIPSTVTTIGNDFLRYASNFNQKLNLSNVTSIGDYFLQDAEKYDQELNLSKTTSIGTGFLQTASNFNQKLLLSPNLTTVPADFLYSATQFNQSLNLPNVTSIGNHFLAYSAFNHPLDLSKVTTIGDYFLQSAHSFNSHLDLSNVTSVGSYFMQTVAVFNQTLSLPKLTSVGSYFMQNCRSFSQPLDLPELETIGSHFLDSCSSFNQPLTIPKAKTIADYFMYTCDAFDQTLTIPSSVSSINGSYLMRLSPNVTKLIVNTSTVPSPVSNTTLTNRNTTKSYTLGITLYGSGATAWKAALPDVTSGTYRRKIIDGTV